jgi:hypothetical protein
MHRQNETQFIKQNRVYWFQYQNIKQNQNTSKKTNKNWAEITRNTKTTIIKEKWRINGEQVTGKWRATRNKRLTWKRFKFCENKYNHNMSEQHQNQGSSQTTTQTEANVRTLILRGESVTEADGHNRVLILGRQKWTASELKKKIQEVLKLQVKKIEIKDEGYLIEMEDYEKARALIEQSSQIHVPNIDDPIYFCFADGPAPQETTKPTHTIVFGGFYYWQQELWEALEGIHIVAIRFMQNYSDVKIDVTLNGSDKEILQRINKIAEIGMKIKKRDENEEENTTMVKNNWQIHGAPKFKTPQQPKQIQKGRDSKNIITLKYKYAGPRLSEDSAFGRVTLSGFKYSKEKISEITREQIMQHTIETLQKEYPDLEFSEPDFNDYIHDWNAYGNGKMVWRIKDNAIWTTLMDMCRDGRKLVTTKYGAITVFIKGVYQYGTKPHSRELHQHTVHLTRTILEEKETTKGQADEVNKQIAELREEVTRLREEQKSNHTEVKKEQEEIKQELKEELKEQKLALIEAESKHQEQLARMLQQTEQQFQRMMGQITRVIATAQNIQQAPQQQYQPMSPQYYPQTPQPQQQQIVQQPMQQAFQFQMHVPQQQVQQQQDKFQQVTELEPVQPEQSEEEYERQMGSPKRKRTEKIDGQNKKKAGAQQSKLNFTNA